MSREKVRSEVGKSWRRDVLNGVLTLTVVIILLFLVSLILPPLKSVLSTALASMFGPHEFGRFLWEVLTGPPVTGALAVLAAYIAYRGLDKTVIRQDRANENALEGIKQAREAAEATAERQDRANENALEGIKQAREASLAAAKRQDDANENTRQANAETARKNSEDQWWATLRWAYDEAKEFKASDSRKETAAVATVLESLSQQLPLSPVQNSTVAAVSLLFKDSPDSKTRMAVQRTQERTAASEYENAVYSMLRNLDFEGVKVSKAFGTPDTDVDFIAIATSDQARVGIMVKARTSPLRERDASNFMQTVHNMPAEKKTITALLLISRAPITDEARERLRDSYPEAAAVQWAPGMNTDRVRLVLATLLSPGSS